MVIIPTKTSSFEELVNNFIKDSKISCLLDLGKMLEKIDQKLFENKQSHLKVVKFKERVIQTTIGMLRFKRRYYYDEFEEKYRYLLDAFLMIPKRNRYMDSVKLKILEAASEMSYEKAGRYACEDNLPASKSTVFRLLHQACFYVEDNNVIIPNPEKIHVQIDEKFLSINHKKTKQKFYTATIFKGINNVGKKRILLNKTLISARTQKTLFNRINSALKRKYKVLIDDEIYVSGDLATYIQNSPSKLLVCKSIYVPDKYHVIHAIKNETNLTVNKFNLNDPIYLEAIAQALEDYDTVNSKKLLKLINRNPEIFSIYIEKDYRGCSQECMNSHYYASRFAKVPNKWNIDTVEKISKIIEAKVNKQIVKIGFADSYYDMPYDLEFNIDLETIATPIVNTEGMPYAMKKFFDRIQNGFDGKIIWTE